MWQSAEVSGHEPAGDTAARTAKTAEDKIRTVLPVLASEMSVSEAARRHGVSAVAMSKWKQAFLDAGAKALEPKPSGPAGAQGGPDQRRFRIENEQLKLALAEVTVQLWIQRLGGSGHVPSIAAKYVEAWPAWGYHKIGADPRRRLRGIDIHRGMGVASPRQLPPVGYHANRKSWAMCAASYSVFRPRDGMRSGRWISANS
ncbi:transposase [Nocardia sp. NPDC051321]|uniref:transposase n=1 Tax=Nocardia sp. NPDC051321 TaxID=3364323 RepID=UPI0037960CEC